MKYIKKNIKNEPKTLKLYRETTPEASYGGFGDTDRWLKKAFLEEQGHICAYCMQRISLRVDQNKLRIKVEHIQAQANYPDKSLDYMNMVGVCNGNEGGRGHCDNSKGNKKLKILFPHKEDCEQLVEYSTSGEINLNSNREEEVKKKVEHDLTTVLNLNHQFLVEDRQAAVKLVIDKLTAQYKGKQWTKKQIAKAIEKYTSRDHKGKFKEFCNYVVWYLLKERPKYK